MSQSITSNFDPARSTVAILYGGEMGAAVACVLRARGVHVMTTLAGRGAQTAPRSRAAGMEILPSLDALLARADIVISLVTPAAAESTAMAVLDALARLNRRACYVDLNSTGPNLARTLATRFAAVGQTFVDGAINGLAKNLTSSATLFLSGELAGDVAALFGDGVKARVLGSTAGEASMMKMLLSGLSKGICALYTEMAVTAEKTGVLAAFNAASSQIYPGIWQLVERMLPTYTAHAARRADEMAELEATVRGAGIEPHLVAALRAAHERIAAVDFSSNQSSQPWDVSTFVDRLARASVSSSQSIPATAGSERSKHGE
jgi:3-hydroxyisobutyrate dehydrogenase-like beta-hydroxyacid dehydrogenase